MATRYLLDTNVVSATRRERTDPQMAAFLAKLSPTDLYLSVLSVGETRKGFQSKHRKNPQDALALKRWMSEVEQAFEGRILDVDETIAKTWGDFSSDRSRPVVDTLIAATAMVHGLTLLTGNTKDLRGLPIKLRNPWMV